MMQAGAMYIHGRDKCYRPILIMDATVLVDLIKKDKDAVSGDVFVELFLFLVHYMRTCMFLPGQVDYWTCIISFANLGITSIPRKPIMAFLECCQQNIMFFINKQFYLNVSWGIKAIYNTVISVVDEETRKKHSLTDKSTLPEIM